MIAGRGGADLMFDFFPGGPVGDLWLGVGARRDLERGQGRDEILSACRAGKIDLEQARVWRGK